MDELTVYDAPAPGALAGAAVRLPNLFAVRAPAPNPSRGEVVFGVELPAAGRLEADVFDLAGRRVRTLARGPAPAGARALAWDGRDERGAGAPPGLYFARLRFGLQTRVVRLVRVP